METNPQHSFLGSKSKLIIPLAVLSLLSACLGLAVILAACARERDESAESYRMASEVSQNLYVGMPYDELKERTQTAWRVYHCDYSSAPPEQSISYDDVYLFGTHNLALAWNISVRSGQRGNDFVVTQVAHFPAEDSSIGYGLLDYCRIFDRP